MSSLSSIRSSLQSEESTSDDEQSREIDAIWSADIEQSFRVSDTRVADQRDGLSVGSIDHLSCLWTKKDFSLQGGKDVRKE